jgi:hypothetical protein
MHYCLKSWRLDPQSHWNGSLFSYHITPIYVQLKLVYNLCTYEVSIEFGSMLLTWNPAFFGRTVVPVPSFVGHSSGYNIALE